MAVASKILGARKSQKALRRHTLYLQVREAFALHSLKRSLKLMV